jgi:hypothetical protein
MDQLSLRPAALPGAVAAYGQAAARLEDGSRLLAAVLTPLLGSADPAVSQEVRGVAAAFRDALDVVGAGHRHAGAALDAATSAVIALDRREADRW